MVMFKHKHDSLKKFNTVIGNTIPLFDCGQKMHIFYTGSFSIHTVPSVSLLHTIFILPQSRSRIMCLGN